MESTNGPTDVNGITKGEYLLEKQKSCHDAGKVLQHTYLSEKHGLGLAESITHEEQGSLNHTLSHKTWRQLLLMSNKITSISRTTNVAASPSFTKYILLC